MNTFLRILKQTLIAILSVIVILVASASIYMYHPKFAKAPSGKRLAYIQNSPRYRNGEFQNLIDTLTYAPGYTL